MPTLPRTATEVLRLSQDPSASVDKIVSLLEHEPAIAARLLSLANSPLFRGKSAFRSGKEAVIRLGLRTVRDLVMQAAVMAKVFDIERFVPRMVELRTHATGVAFACRTIEAASRLKDGWAGLLHDLGKPTLLSLIAKEKNIAVVQPGAIDELLSMRHSVVGAVIAEKMSLPAPISRSIARHHIFDVNDVEDRLAMFVASGDLLWQATLEGTCDSRDAFESSVSTQALGLDAEAVDRVLNQMAEIAPTCQAVAS